jgi:hypothetical protein
LFRDIVFKPRVVGALAQSSDSLSVAINQVGALWSARMTDPLSDAETLKMSDARLITEIGKKPRALRDRGPVHGAIRLRAESAGEFCRAYDEMDRRATDGAAFDRLYDQLSTPDRYGLTGCRRASSRRLARRTRSAICSSTRTCRARIAGRYCLLN